MSSATTPFSDDAAGLPHPDASAEALLATLPWGVLVLDAQRIIRQANEQVARWGETSLEALTGQPLAGATLLPAVRSVLAELLEAGTAAVREVFLPLHEQWLAFSATRQPGGWIIYGQDITSQKRREQQYQALADNTPDVLTRWTPDLRLRYANAAFAHKVGTPLPELLGLTNREMGQPEEIAGPYMATLQRVFDTGQPQEHFNHFPTPQGEVYYYSRLVPELRDGQVETVLGIARDVTTLHQAEQAARQSQALLQSVFEAVPHSIMVLEAVRDENQQVVDFRYQLTNGVADRHMGLDLRGRLLRHLLPGYVDEENFRLLTETVETGRPTERTQYYDAQGGPLWLHSRYRKLGERVVVSHEDVTASRQTQAEALRLRDLQAQQATDQYHALLYSMDEGLCVMELVFDESGEQAVDCYYREFNPAFERQSGMSATALNQSSRTLMPDQEPFWLDTYGRVARTGEAAHFEHYMPAPLNRWFSVHAYRAGGPGSARVAALFSDVTTRKQAEARQTFLLKLGDALRPLSDPAAVQQAAMQVLGEHLAVSRAFYGEVLADENTLVFGLGYAHGLAPLVGQVTFSNFDLDMMNAYRAGRTVVLPDMPDETGYSAQTKSEFAAIGVQAAVGVPLVKEGRVQAILSVHQATPRPWTTAEVSLLEETAELTWAAVERAHAETALAASEAKYRTLFDSIDEGFCVIDMQYDATGRAVDWLYLEANPTFERQTGWQPVGKTINELLGAAEPFWLAFYARVAETGEPGRAENRVEAMNRWYSVFASRVDGPGSRQVAVVFDDITERKHREANLTLLNEVSEDLAHLTDTDATMNALCAKLGVYFEATVCAFSLVDEAAGTVAVQYVWHQAGARSPTGVYRLAEYHSAEVQQAMRAGRPEVVSDTADLPAEVTARLAALHIGAFINLPFVRQGQWLFTLSLTASTPRPRRPDELDLLRELTTRIWLRLERARAEEALRQSEEKYRTLFDSIDEGYCLAEVLLDEAGQPVDVLHLEVNQAHQRTSGLGDIVGRRLLDFMPAVEPEWLAFYGNVVLTGQPARIEYHVDAVRRWFTCHASRVGGAGSRLVAIIFNDITERKHREANQELLVAVTDELAGLRTPVETLPRLAEKIGRHFGVQRCMLNELSADSETSLTTQSWTADGLAVLQGPYRMRDFLTDEQFEAHKAGQLSVVDDTQTDPRVSAESYAALDIHSFIIVPLVREQRWQFLLSIIDNQPRHWRADEVALLRELTDRIWTRLERARAEEALAASEVKYRTLFESIDEGFCIIEVLFDEAGKVVDYRFLETNPAFIKQTGWPDAVGKTMREIAPNHEEVWFETYGRIVRTGQPEWVEYLVAAIGSWFSLYAFRMGAPEQHRVATIFNDITERKEQQQRQQFLLQLSDALRPLTDPLALQQATVQLLAEHFGVMRASYFEMDADGDTFRLPARAKHDAVPIPDAMRLSDFAPEMAAAYRAGHTLVFNDTETDRHLGSEPAAYRPLGIRAWMAVPLVRQGRLLMMLGLHSATPRHWTAAEIQLLEETAERTWMAVERARAEAALRVSDANYAALFAASPVPFMVLAPNRPDFTITAANDAYYAATLTTPASLLGRRLFDIFPDDATRPGQLGSEALATSLDYVLATKRADAMPRVRYDILTPGGEFTPHWWLAINAPLLDPAGRISAIIHQVTRVTELHLAEETLRASEQQLQAATQQQALFEAVQAAQEAERKRMAESLHNGIGQILYATKLRLEQSRALAPTPTAAAQALRQETDALLSDAIRQTRALSHELVPLVLEEFGLAAALQDIGRKMSTPQLRFSCLVQLDADAAPLAPPLQMALYRITQELAQNIVKHAHGATEASLELETIPGWVLLRVEDNGPGFTTTAANSPGLGLRSIRDRVALLGGQLESGSIPVGGAYVRLRIPLPAAPA